jgi:hypothetical protein
MTSEEPRKWKCFSTEYMIRVKRFSTVFHGIFIAMSKARTKVNSQSRCCFFSSKLFIERLSIRFAGEK